RARGLAIGCGGSVAPRTHRSALSQSSAPVGDLDAVRAAAAIRLGVASDAGHGRLAARVALAHRRIRRSRLLADGNILEARGARLGARTAAAGGTRGGTVAVAVGRVALVVGGGVGWSRRRAGRRATH